MLTIKVDPKQTQAIVKRAMFLAYQACGGAFGMGIFQDRGAVTEEQVWKNVCTEGDYTYTPEPNPDKTAGVPEDKDVDVYGDYVFGRMFKMGMKFNRAAGTIKVREEAPRGDYQAWCHAYPTYKAVVDAAIESLKGQKV